MPVIDLADIGRHFSLELANDETIDNHSADVWVEVRTGTSVHGVAAIEELAYISAYVLLYNELASWMIKFELFDIYNIIIEDAKLFAIAQPLVILHSWNYFVSMCKGFLSSFNELEHNFENYE